MATSPSGQHVATTPYKFFTPKTGHTVTLTSITRVTTTATATKVGHGFRDGDTVTIAGATVANYNGSYVITVTSNDVFTYTVADSGATPATGTITATGADQAVFNSDTLVSDTQLAQAVAANESYEIDFNLFYSNTDDTTSGLKLSVTAPAGAKGYFMVVSDQIAATPAVAFAGTVTLSNSLDATVQNRKVRVVVHNGATAGTVQLKFAQSAAAPATQSIIYAGSYVKVEQLYPSVVF